jgi:hypothetical protein
VAPRSKIAPLDAAFAPVGSVACLILLWIIKTSVLSAAPLLSRAASLDFIFMRRVRYTSEIAGQPDLQHTRGSSPPVPGCGTVIAALGSTRANKK